MIAYTVVAEGLYGPFSVVRVETHSETIVSLPTRAEADELAEKWQELHNNDLDPSLSA